MKVYNPIDATASHKAAADKNTREAQASLDEVQRDKSAAATQTRTGDDINRANAAAWPGNRQG